MIKKNLMINEFYMNRCLYLAKKGLGYTYPNPMVGCVVVYDNKIIGEGWHQNYGSSHAEVNAIKNINDPSVLIKSTLFVNLEPCNHFGKTPPCTDLIIKHKIPKIVIGVKDPNRIINRDGIAKLKNAGCKIILNIMKKECIHLNKRFFTFHEKKRPYIILKWARSLDGYVTPISNQKKSKKIFWITNPLSIQRAHKLRSNEDGIIVGVNTIINDDPKLTLRNWKGNHPKRYIIDPNLRIPKKSKILNDKHPVKILNSTKSLIENNKEWIKCNLNNVSNILNLLYKENLQSVIVEGGAKTIQYFIDENLWDEAQVFTGNKLIKKGLKEPKLDIKESHIEKIGYDKLSFFYPI